VPQDLLPLLIPVVGIVIFVFGFIAMRRRASSLDPANPTALASGTPSGLRPSPGESREAFVRRHWQRPGVVANGVTLVDLYNRIATLEQRITELERERTDRPSA
jgi:hypothetical protein